MKSLFSTIMNNSLFNVAKRLAFVCVFLSITAAAAGSTYQSKMTVKVATNSTGKGKVWVTKTDNKAPAENEYDTENSSSQGIIETKTHTYYLYALANEGYYHFGWSIVEAGTSIVDNSATGTTQFAVPVTASSTDANNPTSHTRYAVFKEQVVYKDYTRAIAMLVKIDGTPELDNEGNPVKDGGYVNIGSDAVDQVDVPYGSLTNYKSINASSHTWNYEYYAKPKANYKFMGWFKQSDLMNQITTNGKVDFAQAESSEEYYNKTDYSTTTPYSRKEDAPSGDVMIAVFRPSLTYYHYGPHVTIGGDAEDRADKGHVYADGGTAATIDGVPDDKWKIEIYDKNIDYKEDDPKYGYTFYAETEQPTMYAFKGWAYAPFDEPIYYDNPFVATDIFLATDDNITPENPYLTPTLYAIFESYFYKAPPASFANLSEDLGSIAVSLGATNTPAWSEVNVNASTDLQQVAANGDSYEYSVHYYAKKKVGSYFLGWSTTADGQNLIPGSATEENGVYHYVPIENYVTRAKDKDYPHVAAPLYAVFRSDIDIRQQDRMIVYIDDEGNGNINDAKVLVDFQKADILTATLSGADASFFTLSNRSGSKSGKTINFDATQGLIELVVSYTNDDLRTAVGKKAEITFSANYEGQTVTRSIVIVVEEAPIITFLPTDGKGTYTVKMTNGSGVNYTMDKNTKENLKVAVTHESMSNIEMNLTEDVSGMTDKYYFFGWQMIDGDEVTYLSYDELCTYQFTKSVKVRAQFVHLNHATYFIKDDITNTPYSDLALALADASKLKNSTGKPQIVVFNAKPNGTKITEGILPQGDYTIPEGVTLLIPGDNDNNHATSHEELNYEGSGSEYVKWTIEKGATITVKGGGAVSIYANIQCGGANNPNGKPAQYGHIQLGENVKMTFENGARLYAFGYITGSQTASVLMKDGSEVKEMFQIYDWRGGRASAQGLYGMLMMGSGPFQKDEVFLVGQYYVQNIEVPLTLEPNAKEILVAGILVSEDVTHTEVTFMSADVGFFQMGDATTITKYYNADEDRLVFVVAQQPGKSATKVAKLGGVSLTIKIEGIGRTINSADYVLPLPHNYDVIMKDNATVQVLHDNALLPGATLTINKGCTCDILSNLFVYDKKYSTKDGVGYFSVYNSEYKTITGRPGGILYTRTSSDLVDAKIVVDGILNCTSTGALYTTNSSSETTDHANITSHGGGKVLYGTLGTKTKTYQAKQSSGAMAISTVSIPVAPARLLNATTQYQVPAANTSYTYVNGKWTANGADQQPIIPAVKNNIPTFTVSPSYTFSTYVGESQSTPTNIVTSNNNVDWTTVTWAYSIVGQDADQFSFTWGTKPAATVKFTPKSEGVKKAVLRITATYEKAYANASGKHKHIYTKDVQLIGNASYLKTNTLAFADLSIVYAGKNEIALLKDKNSNGKITVKVENNSSEISINGSAGNQTFEMDYSTQNSFNALKEGEVTITVSQDADLTSYIAATTITKKVKVTERVVWNWDILYFGTVNENPITVLDGSTGWTLVESKDTSNVVAFDKNTLKATIEDQIAGKYGAEFTFKLGEYSKIFKSVIITNPQHLRVDVNNDTVFRAVTLSANETVTYNTSAKAIQFQSTSSSISQWKMTFVGVPDKIHFQPVGSNAWQIEESANGINWTTSFPWKYITSNSDFEMSLLPSTRYLRISYGAGATTPAALKDLYITELAHVKADVEKLYMPMQLSDATDNTLVIPASKELVLTYANTSKLYVTTSDKNIYKITGSTDNILTIPATTDETPFGIMGIEVVSQPANNTEEKQGYLYVHEGANLVLQIPIRTYKFPQELPIKLATDKPDGGDRYYYVTTRTHNAEWNGEERTITLNNAVSDAAPSLTFAFEGAPTYIQFQHTTAKGTWEIEQSVDGKEWDVVPHNADIDIMDGQQVKRTVKPESKYLRVIYESPYAEKIELTELIIVGDASAVAEPARLELDYNQPKAVTVSVVNLPSMKVTSKSGNFKIALTEAVGDDTELTLPNGNDLPLGENVMGNLPIYVMWVGNDMVEYSTLEITNPAKDNELLATVELVGQRGELKTGTINIYTGVDADKYTLEGAFEEEAKQRRLLDINAAFSADETPKPLFDYVVVYGETTTNDGSTTITVPNTMLGSNAKTPVYIYKKNDTGTAYTFFKRIDNANSKEKAWNVTSDDDADAVTIPSGKTSLSMYITGFCPYASTGYTKADEGVWYFKGSEEQKIDIYLEHCYLYSRYKTENGHSFADRSDGYSFVEPYVRGSGAVLVFACQKKDNKDKPMEVTIHTLNRNILKSHYGCFLQSVAGRAYQASSPVQIRVLDNTYIKTSATTLNFTDKWPASQNALTDKRTNGFLSLQKQVNNAPSIDMGNGNTIVNFNGGQVELQNAQIVSPNYKSSLAICPRAGTFAGILLAYGMGTDDVGGTVNFYDGTTTVQEMWVSPDYFESYLCDKNDENQYIRNSRGEYLTTCLRTPKNTFVYGGSHCMMRACSDPESQGGAPKSEPGEDGVLLGLYKYPSASWSETVDGNPITHKGGWNVVENGNGLVTVDTENLPNQNYRQESITPNTNGTTTGENPTSDDFLNFWVPEGYDDSVTPEIDKKISYWKTCMTKISAMYAGQGGSVGGDTQVEMAGDLQTELVKYLLYCKIDDKIHEVIASPDYQAPVKNPAPEGGNYLPIHPSEVGQATEHFISNEKPFQVENKLYYITTATADVWNAFTAPFDVAKIYIMETYSEDELEKMEYEGGMMRDSILLEQAKHNADFASFFGVTIALGQNKNFETIYGEYMSWAKLQDTENGLYASGKYDLRGMRELIPFDGNNWATADFYLNENKGDWTLKYDGKDNDYVGNFETTWEIPTLNDNTIMEQGKTYSMLLPFCMGCVDYEKDKDDEYVLDDNGEKIPIERTYWDYWSGKFLIFESTDGPHTINGKDYATSIVDNATYIDESAVLTGNSTFAEIKTTNEEIFTYEPNIAHSTFYPIQLTVGIGGTKPRSIVPTESFLVADLPTPAGQKIVGITRSGKVLYNTSGDGNTTGTHMPTVGGGNEFFITAISGGINVAVAYPQHVRVLSATGAVIYSGMVQTAVDVNLPTDGIYIVSGEKEVQKILY